MKIYRGEPVSEGIARGPALVWKKERILIQKQLSNHPEEEIKRVVQALELAREQIRELCGEAVTKAGEDQAAIFEVHLMMLEDEEFLENIYRLIRAEQVKAEYAVSAAGGALSDLFAGIDDEYMKARYIDVDDIASRLVRNLTGAAESSLGMKRAGVILTEDMTPSEALKLDREKTLALVTVHGSANSHTAILARAMKIPAVAAVDVNLDQIQEGTDLVVDGTRGEVIIETV